jgi:hypothetical protein
MNTDISFQYLSILDYSFGSEKVLFKINQNINCDRIFILVGIEVLTAVVMNSTIFWDITTCNPLSVNRRFGKYIASIFRGEK